MTSPHPTQIERALLCDLLDEVGPSAPTLIEGWSTDHLAAHLWVREHDVRGLPGLGLPALHGVTLRLEERARRDRPFTDLVRDLRVGPPFFPMGLPGLADRSSLHELFVHHEDVRRAHGMGPRTDIAATHDAIWGVLPAFGWMLARPSPVGVTLVAPDGRRRRVRRGVDSVEVHGQGGELLLDLFGRRDVADVEVQGSPSAVARYREAPLGL